MREDNFATRSVRVKEGEELAGVESLRDALKAEPELVIVFGDAIQGEGCGSWSNSAIRSAFR